MWLRLPAPEDVDCVEHVRRALLNTQFSPVVNAHDGQKGMSAGAVTDFVDHVNDLQFCSEGVRSYALRRARRAIPWTKEQIVQLLGKLEGWVRENAQGRFRDFELLDNARDAVVDLLSNVFVPVVAEDLPVMQRMIDVTRAIDRAAGGMTAVYLLSYLVQGGDSTSLGDVLLDAFYDPTERTAARLIDAGRTFVRWIEYSGRGMCAPPSDVLVGRVVDALMGRRMSVLSVGLEFVSHLLEFFPAILDERSLSSIERALRFLADATKLGPNVPSDEAAHREARSKPKLRAAAARAAFQLSKVLKARPKPASPVVEQWRAICENDPLPEVRRAWLAP